MNEATWLACTDPAAMLQFLGGKVSERKRRLFACACGRYVWPLLADPRARDAVAVAERWADGTATPGELAAAQADVREALKRARLRALRELDKGSFWASLRRSFVGTEGAIAEAAADALAGGHFRPGTRAGGRYPMCAAYGALLALAPALGLRHRHGRYGQSPERDLGAARCLQPAILRDLFGNPFRPVSVNPAWLLWEGGPAEAAEAVCAEPLPHGALSPSTRPQGDGTVRRLAEALYGDPVFDRLAALAGALEGAGCTNDDILGHLRGPGPHVRGCWAVDCLLGRE